jgi:hypothetical protein
MDSRAYICAADAVLIAHLLFIGWVIFGALFTRSRPRLAVVHILTIIYGIIAETTPLVCPLTLAENWCEVRAGVLPYHGPFLLHYLDATVYPNVPLALLITVAVLICTFNLGLYARRFKRRHSLG